VCAPLFLSPAYAVEEASVSIVAAEGGREGITMNVLYPPTLDFGFMRQRPQQLMLQFARHGHRVFFCNLTQDLGRDPEEVAPNLVVVHDHDRFVRENVPGLGKTLVWCSWALLHDMLDLYNPSLVVFDCVDDFAAWHPHEGPMLAKAAAVVVTSHALEQRLRPHHPRLAVIPNGCDFAFFSTPPQGPPPADLPLVRRPRAVFAGAWGSWVDSAAVARAARLLSHWDFILIGPEFGGLPIRGRNLHWLGMRPYELLPAYLHEMDVALIPFLDNEVSRAANPVKLWEYLATGKPIVSTPLPEVMPLGDLVRVASPEHFAKAISEALFDQQRKPERIATASRNSWEARYEAIVRFLPELEG
jgi:teichuronic acid biosynthesis glycosyltransferase TuaH